MPPGRINQNSTMFDRISFDQIKNIASWWKTAGGASKIEIAALEPLLWKDGKHSISDVVSMLKDMDFFVTMTTNGSTLTKHANSLKRSGLDLLRISWHSLDADVFRKITGGGKLTSVYNGIIAAIDCNLPLKINRVLLKGYINDLGEHIKFIDCHKLTLKILDLYWTPSSADLYNKYYISPMDALNDLIEEHQLIEITSNTQNNTTGRHRKIYRTPNGGAVEFKIKETAQKTATPCQKCSFINECLEGYGDYFRVFPNGDASLCYLRTDLSTKNYDSIFSNGIMPLRLVLEGRCNFNCGFPTEQSSWCLKQGRGFIFPNRSGVIEIESQH